VNIEANRRESTFQRMAGHHVGEGVAGSRLLSRCARHLSKCCSTWYSSQALPKAYGVQNSADSGRFALAV